MTPVKKTRVRRFLNKPSGKQKQRRKLWHQTQQAEHTAKSGRRQQRKESERGGKHRAVIVRSKPARKNALDRVYDGRSHLPTDYIFVPSGNVYLTRNCRKETLLVNRPVYAVQSSSTSAGIYIPRSIHIAVANAARSTAASRATAVQKREGKLRADAQGLMRELYPEMPLADEESVLRRAFAKNSGRVGRSTKLEMRVRVHRAVEAYIRHTKTPYDALIDKRKHDKQAARGKVRGKIEELKGLWRGEGDRAERCLK